MTGTLDLALIAAHARHDGPALVRLYAEAAEAAHDVDAACFFLTHAYVYALELGHPHTDALYARLAAQGRV